MFGSVLIHHFVECHAHRRAFEDQATLAERERVNVELLEKVDTLSTKRRQADDKLASLWAELDLESAAQRRREGELDRLWWKLEKERSEFEKDSKLPTVSKTLGAADQLATEWKAELERERFTFRWRRHASNLICNRQYPKGRRPKAG